MIGFRRHKNLKEILSPTAFPTNKNKQVVLDTGCKKCNKKCYVCRYFLQESPTITSLATGIKYKIEESLSCKDNWVVYCATCLKCQKQDVGSTVTEFYTCWGNHKSHINTKKKTCTLAKHFIEQKCGLQNLKVTLIEKVKVKNLDYLEDREGHCYLLCNHMALMSEKNLKGVPTNLSLSITRFVCCSHRTQLSFFYLSIYF